MLPDSHAAIAVNQSTTDCFCVVMGSILAIGGASAPIWIPPYDRRDRHYTALGFETESLMTNMRLLICNPNSSKSVTDGIAVSLGSIDGVQLDYFTAPPSAPSYIVSHATEMQSAAISLSAILALDQSSFDGLLVACFSHHPLVHALREALPNRQPVVSIFEASIVHAMQLGGTFAIITTTPKWEPMLRQGLEDLNLAHRCRGVTAVLASMDEASLMSSQDVADRLIVASRHMVKEKGADVLILGGAKFAGFENAIRDALPGVELVDAMRAGLELLIGLCRCGSKTAKTGTYADP